MKDVLLGDIKRPAKVSRPRKKDWMAKHYLWALTLELAEDFGLDLTRNDATTAKISACDAVAEALSVCGRETKYTEIKNLMVHSDFERRRAEFRVSEKIFARIYDKDAPSNALRPEYYEFWSNAANDAVLDIFGTFPSTEDKKRD